MKLTIVNWKKGNTVLPLRAWECDCGGVLREVGSAGCPHDSNYTYFFQCEKCLRVDSTDRDIITSGNPDTENMTKAGWVIV